MSLIVSSRALERASVIMSLTEEAGGLCSPSSVNTVTLGAPEIELVTVVRLLGWSIVA